jgi:hypothetical protein
LGLTDINPGYAALMIVLFLLGMASWALFLLERGRGLRS